MLQLEGNTVCVCSSFKAKANRSALNDPSHVMAGMDSVLYIYDIHAIIITINVMTPKGNTETTGDLY